MTTSKNESKFAVLRTFALVLSIYGVAMFIQHASGAAQNGLPRTALWNVVHDVCVPGQSQQQNPMPCLKVELSGGIKQGFAILKDPRGVAQFLLIPTVQISGIESPDILGPTATNYFAEAWGARKLLDNALGKSLARDGVGLAINSEVSRSQDQLHIHIACVHANVLGELQKNQEQIGDQWAPFNVSLFGRHYQSMWLSGENLAPNNPFKLLAKIPGAARAMGSHTLVVIGFTRVDGTKGFVLLTDRVKKETDDLANGEELLDRFCRIATPNK